MPDSAHLPEGFEPRRHQLSGDPAPAQAVRWLREDAHPVALIGEWLATVAVLGSCPLVVAPPDADVFALLDAQSPLTAGDVRVGGGWIGWLGYRLGHEVEELGPDPPAPRPRPRFSLAFYDHVVVRDEDGWWFEELWTPARDAALAARRELWRARLAGTPPPPPRGDARPSPMRIVGNGAAGHVAAVAECRGRIAAGELFQANLCLRLEGSYDGDGLDLFCRALERGAPRFGAWVDGAVSLSPERFLRRVGDRVSSDPIKGTRPRTEDAAAAREELEASTKDAAEHVMIVDLMRNDLGRVSRYGSVRAHRRRVEAHAGVWHLVSEVSGRLREGVGDGALLRATFPPGSVTGAPKVQAMKVISELEGSRRELYTGAIGISGPVAGLELSVAIRTFEMNDGRIWFGAGGGIVADSDPELELAEALAKAAGPLAAVGGRLDPPARARPQAPPVRIPRALAHGRRPDPRAGVFETVLVQDGAAVALEAHVVRLRDSLERVYGLDLGTGVGAEIERAVAATGGQRARMRVAATAGGTVTVSAVPAALAPEQVLVLAPFVLPGGLGAHKWSDRQLLEALSHESPGAVPLLIDSDGAVLEAAYANVWIVEDGIWVTPPADGRILPGVTRADQLSGDRAAREEPISLQRLREASAVFLTSSIAGRRAARLIEPAQALGVPCAE
ncbi:MAG TPA: chorismate-binding protein [Solirubrobacteraceae bacterium]|nr:chorismate-binding protein [Solirubrobacteraceae bacterium]